MLILQIYIKLVFYLQEYEKIPRLRVKNILIVHTSSFANLRKVFMR
jgi:hypothetical protein